jgi:hypothetical protein
MAEERILNGETDERLAKALEASNYRVTLANQRKNARLKLNRFLTYPKNGGVFFVTKELISFIQSLLIAGKESTILLDSNENPIEILNLEEFFEEIYDRYYQAMNDFLIDYKENQKARSVSKLVFKDRK